MKGLLFLFLLLPEICFSSAEWEGFLDTYYAYDFSHPPRGKRSFTTQPSRHNEPNINLAYGAMKWNENSYRGRFAVQGGNSVEANTLAETSDLRYLQEAYLGKRISEKTWIDGGIYLGHIGAESWISRENWTYTRALNLDYVPYYTAGLRITHENFQFHLMNGWQNMREDNQAKAVGIQYVSPLNERMTFTYNNFFGDEEVVSSRARFRGYHNFILKWTPPGTFGYLAAVDLGHQSQQENDGVDAFGAASLTVRKTLSETQSIAVRVEHYADPHGANVTENFVTSGASVNFDQAFPRDILWRTELRGYTARADAFVVTSLSILLR